VIEDIRLPDPVPFEFMGLPARGPPMCRDAVPTTGHRRQRNPNDTIRRPCVPPNCWACRVRRCEDRGCSAPAPMAQRTRVNANRDAGRSSLAASRGGPVRGCEYMRHEASPLDPKGHRRRQHRAAPRRRRLRQGDRLTRYITRHFCALDTNTRESRRRRRAGGASPSAAR